MGMPLGCVQMKTIALLTFLLASVPAFAASYYVDFDGGSDAAAGTSTGAAWKHCPGDSSATGTAAATTPAAGSFVNFKGGVVYRGRVTIGGSGTLGSPVVYQTGPAWGTGVAIVSGATNITETWTVCTNSTEVHGNTNFASIWRAAIPAGWTIWSGLFQDTLAASVAQYPRPTNRFNWDRVSEEWALADSLITRTSVVSSAVFTSSDSSYYDSSWLGVWVQGNRVALQPITSFVPASDSVRFTLSSVADPYTDSGMARFAVLGHPALIAAAGEYAVKTNENRIYFWPFNGVNPNSASLAAGNQKLLFQGYQDHITFSNLVFANSYAHPITDAETEHGGAINIGGYPTGRSGITVTNCVFRDCISPETGGHLVYLYGGGLAAINGNSFSNSATRGIIINGGATNSITGNTVASINGTTMEVWYTTNTTIHGNSITLNTGVHANAITAYDGNDGVTISANRVSQSIRMLTFQACRNLSVWNNVFDGSGIGSIHEWSSTMGGNVRFLNNTIASGVDGEPVLYLGASTATYTVQNNIIDGLSFGGVGSYNIYTEPAYTPSLGTGESTNTIVAICPSFASGDFTPVSTVGSGFPVDAGSDQSALFTTDFTGATRSAPWDIGAYEYDGGSPTPAATSTAVSATVGTLIVR